MTSCIVIIGKPGAGKSSIGSELARLVGGTYVSLGAFMRGTLGIPDPHIGVDKTAVYEALHARLAQERVSGTLVLDCHPYPEGDLKALQAFIANPSLSLRAVLYVEASDAVALGRLRKRVRPGQTDEERLKYFNDNVRYIDLLMQHPRAIRVENNVDFADMDSLTAITQGIVRKLSRDS